MVLRLFFLTSLLPLALQFPARAAEIDPTPDQGWIRLRPRYQLEEGQGIDSQVGRIWKKGGMEVEYDIGKCAGNDARRAASGKAGWLAWHTERTVAGRKVEVTLTWDRILYVTVGGMANFSAHVRSDEDITDLMLMAMSYKR